MGEIEIPKPVAIAIAAVVAVLLVAGIWWRAGASSTQGTANAQSAVSTRESQEFTQSPPPTVKTGAPTGPRD